MRCLCLLVLERFFLCSLLICGLTGCPGPGRQPTAWIDSFASNGASRDEIRKAFLECGASVPGDIVEYRTLDGKMFPELGANENILVVKCMQRSGFRNNSYIPCRGWTENGKHVPNNLPACQPDAVIPKRSVENRINSPYCKTYSKTKICQPDYAPPKDDLSPPTNPNLSPKSISIAPSIDPAIKLQNQVQKDSNSQMNQLLQGAGGRK